MSKTIVAIILSFLTLAAVAATDTYKFDFNGMNFTLTHQPCTNPTILSMTAKMRLQDGSKPTWYAGIVNYPNVERIYAMCYTVNPANTRQIFIVDEDGDGGLVARPLPKPEGV